MSDLILLVEPDEFVLSGFAMALERRGFEVLTALNERDCMRRLCESAPDVLILEPDTGNDWGRRILTRQDATFPSVPIVVVSRCHPDEMEFSSEPKYFRWLTKPVTTCLLEATVKQAVM